MSYVKNTSEMMDISLSPSTSTQCPENSKSTLKTLYPKLISSCQRSELLSCAVTPENKDTLRKIAINKSSPFVQKKVPFNPFNYNLKERLEKPIFSPDVFSVVMSPSQDTNEFKWTIDDLSKINPAHIEEEFHVEEQTDEQTESEMQNTIDRYFTKIHMVPSPWATKLPTSWKSFTKVVKNESQELCAEQQDMSISSSPYQFSLSHVELVSKSPFQDVSTQTVLSLPPDLPESINAALKPYFSQNECEEIDLSMNSLRRKLCFKTDDEDVSPVRCFGGKDESPVTKNCYPLTPVIWKRTDCSLVEKFSPPDLSPISRLCDTKSCNNSPNLMQTDSSILENENMKNSSSDSRQIIHTTTIPNFQECFKVFESPKCISGKRRNRKRRRSLSQDLDVSVSYASFAAKQTVKNSIRKHSSIGEKNLEIKENSIESQDTGYLSDSSNFQSNISDFKCVNFECWKKNNKENVIIASTPTN